MDREYSAILDYIPIVVEEENNLYYKRPMAGRVGAQATRRGELGGTEGRT